MTTFKDYMIDQAIDFLPDNSSNESIELWIQELSYDTLSNYLSLYIS